MSDQVYLIRFLVFTVEPFCFSGGNNATPVKSPAQVAASKFGFPVAKTSSDQSSTDSLDDGEAPPTLPPRNYRVSGRAAKSAPPQPGNDRVNDHIGDRVNDRVSDRVNDRVNDRTNDRANDPSEWSGSFDGTPPQSADWARPVAPPAGQWSGGGDYEGASSTLDDSYARQLRKQAAKRLSRSSLTGHPGGGGGRPAGGQAGTGGGQQAAAGGVAGATPVMYRSAQVARDLNYVGLENETPTANGDGTPVAPPVAADGAIEYAAQNS